MAFDCQMLQLMDGHEPVAITRSLRFCLDGCRDRSGFEGRDEAARSH